MNDIHVIRKADGSLMAYYGDLEEYVEYEEITPEEAKSEVPFEEWSLDIIKTLIANEFESNNAHGRTNDPDRFEAILTNADFSKEQKLAFFRSYLKYVLEDWYNE